MLSWEFIRSQHYQRYFERFILSNEIFAKCVGPWFLLLDFFFPSRSQTIFRILKSQIIFNVFLFCFSLLSMELQLKKLNQYMIVLNKLWTQLTNRNRVACVVPEVWLLYAKRHLTIYKLVAASDPDAPNWYHGQSCWIAASSKTGIPLLFHSFIFIPYNFVCPIISCFFTRFVFQYDGRIDGMCSVIQLQLPSMQTYIW